MKKFNVYSGDSPAHVAVQQGWCWPAFWFGPYWGFSKGLTNLSITILLVFVVGFAPLGYWGETVGGKAEWLINLILFPVGLTVACWFGACGGKRLEAHWKAKGYKLEGTVTAETGEAAIVQFSKARA